MRIYRTGTSTWKWERTTADLPNALSIQCLTSTCRDDTPRRNKKWHNLAINSQNVQGNLKEKTFFYGPSHFNLRICCSLEWLALSTLSGSKWLRFLLEGCARHIQEGKKEKGSRSLSWNHGFLFYGTTKPENKFQSCFRTGQTKVGK